MENIRILFTGVGRRVELLRAFRQAALYENVDLKIYGADMAGTAPALCYCDYMRKVCGMKEPGYIDELLKICKEDGIDLVIPTIDTDLLVLSENREKFEKCGTRVLISAPEMIRICRDKNNTSQFFADCGLAAPMPVNDYKKYVSGFPAFIKPKDGSSSINAYKVEDEEELEMYAGMVEDYIVQPFVEGREYTIDIFCDFEGRPLSIVPRERMQVRAGEVLKTQIFMDEVMIAEARAICEKFRPCGPITVQLIRDKNSGRNYYIEINPRYGGGAPLSMKAGARSAVMLMGLLLGKDVPYCDTIADGAIYSRFDDSVCIREGKAPIKGVIFDLDDTLYPEKEYVRSGYRKIADALGRPECEDILWGYFLQKKSAIDELAANYDISFSKEELLEIYRQQNPDIHLYEGAKELIEGLKRKGIKVGIITDGRVTGQSRKIEALGLDKIIDDIIITDFLGGVQFRKPCDIAFRIMQNRWRLPFESICYVGDNLSKDFNGPRQLGMKSIYIRNTDGLYYREEDMVPESVSEIDRLTDLEDIL